MIVRAALTAILALLLAGCQLYWRKPGADQTAFIADHEACARATGAPSGAGDGRVLVNLELYRACLKSRGWQRETGSSVGVTTGVFRGLEEPGPVKPDELPPQVKTYEPMKR